MMVLFGAPPTDRDNANRRGPADATARKVLTGLVRHGACCGSLGQPKDERTERHVR